MQKYYTFAFLFTLWLARSPIANAQQDDDDDDDASTASAIKTAEQAVSEANAGPALPQTQEPVNATLANVTAVAVNMTVTAAPTATTLPAAINMVSSLNRFGQEHNSLNHFGQQHFEGSAPEANSSTETNATEELTKEEQDVVDSKHAHGAAEKAMNAADEANKVANSSVKLTVKAQDALKHARDAVHEARVDTAGLSSEQKQSLKAAEAKLHEATKRAEYGALKNAKYVKAEVENKKLEKLQKKMESVKKAEKIQQKELERKEAGQQGIQNGELERKRGGKQVTSNQDSELEAMRKEIQELRKELKKKEGDKADDDAMLKDLQDQIKQMEKEDKKEDKQTKESHDEMKAEIEKLRGDIKSMEDDKEDVPEVVEEKKEVEKYKVNIKPLQKEDGQEDQEVQEEVRESPATPVESKGIDIDTAMPYGDLEPFGREDTAQELTEDSIAQSDQMVDQLERAEVSEEKRAVFRALTRLRGAAITSFDGVARSQTGSIDEYNKIHKWRNTHPLHHLADEESDISKWAFPEDAD